MAKSQTCLEEKGWRGHRFIFLLSSTSSLIWRQADGIREHGGQRRLGTAQEQLGARGLGVWDPTEQAACERGGWNRSTDRLMAPALHTIGFSLPELRSFGERPLLLGAQRGAQSHRAWAARPDSIRRNERHRATQHQRGRWLYPERQGWESTCGATGPLS